MARGRLGAAIGAAGSCVRIKSSRKLSIKASLEVGAMTRAASVPPYKCTVDRDRWYRCI